MPNFGLVRSVMFFIPPGRIPTMRVGHRTFPLLRGYSLIELLCVMAIISVLVGLLLGPVGKALNRARGLVAEIDHTAHVDELRLRLAPFVEQHAEYRIPDLDALVQLCPVSSKCERFLRSKNVRFRSFTHADPGDRIVLEVTFLQKGGRQKTVLGYSKEHLSTRPHYAP